MPRLLSQRPDATEYASYYGNYISKVPEGDVLDLMGSQLDETLAVLRAVPESRGDASYAPGKWTLKEVLGHMIDAERVFAYRALRFARNDPTPLPGFEQDDYVRYARFGGRRVADLLGEFELVRRASIPMFRGLDDEALMRRGVANGVQVSVRAIAFIIVGHERHHLGILKERYL